MDPTEVPLPIGADADLSPLEQDVLDEYERLAENMKKVSPFLPPFPFRSPSLPFRPLPSYFQNKN